MKSDHRHELKTNELADWMAHFPEWAKQNRTNLILVAVVIIAAVAVYFWSFYRRDVVSVRNQARLTSLVTQVPQQISSIARAAMQNTEQSYVLLPIAQDLQEFAQSTSNDDMAALALIERAEALRAELHYRLADVSREELTKQIDQARVSYEQALDRKPSAALAAAAEFGLGLCEEELGMSEKATEIQITLQSGFHASYFYSFCSRMVDDRSGHAGCHGFQDVFNRVRSQIFTQKKGGFVCVQLKRLLVSVELLCTVKLFNRRTIMAAVDPFVVDPKLEFCDGWSLFNRIDRAK